MDTKTEEQAFTVAQPEEEHRWLGRLVGEWAYEGEAEGESGKAIGTETVRSLGGLWILAEGVGEVPGADATANTLMTLGYNPQTKRYVGTWIGSMMTHMWVYDGGLDAAGKELTLNCEGPSMAGDGSMSRYRDVIEIVNDDHRILKAYVEDNGAWRQFMTTHYRRTR